MKDCVQAWKSSFCPYLFFPISSLSENFSLGFFLVLFVREEYLIKTMEEVLKDKEHCDPYMLSLCLVQMHKILELMERKYAWMCHFYANLQL